MRASDEVGPPDEKAVPLLVAIGRAVVTVAALPDVLRMDTAGRLVERHGLGEEFEREVAALESNAHAPLSDRLRNVGLPAELVARIVDVIARRDRLVHGSEYRGAPAENDGGELLDRIDAITRDCIALIGEMLPPARSRLQEALDASSVEVLQPAETTSDEIHDANDVGFAEVLDRILETFYAQDI